MAIRARQAFFHKRHLSHFDSRDPREVGQCYGGAHHSTLSSVIPPPSTASARQAIFERLRDPSIPLDQSSDGDMPMIWSDIYDTAGHDSSQPLTKTQYSAMRNWNDGNFTNDWVAPPGPATEISPGGLDRAAWRPVWRCFFPRH